TRAARADRGASAASRVRRFARACAWGAGIAVAGVCDRGLSQHQSSLGFGVLRAAAQLGEGGKSRRVIRVAGEGITVVADGLVTPAELDAGVAEIGVKLPPGGLKLYSSFQHFSGLLIALLTQQRDGELSVAFRRLRRAAQMLAQHALGLRTLPLLIERPAHQVPSFVIIGVFASESC